MKLKIGVFFGSRSVEHEVSIITVQEAIRALEEKYEVFPVYISKDGRFFTGNALKNIDNFKDLGSLLKKCTNLNFSLDNSRHFIYKNSFFTFRRKIMENIDIAFPIIHGTFGEDGTIQGLFEMMNIPYIGSNVLSSSLCMDKIFTKYILKANSYKIIDFFSLFSREFLNDREKTMDKIEAKLKYPLIAKPANLGSSIGIEVIKNRKELENALESITFLSEKLIVEKFLEEIEEMNISVLGDYEEQNISNIEKLINKSDILTYEKKYINGQGLISAKRELPAKTSVELENLIKMQAKDIFKLFNCSGVVRIDFIFDKKENVLYMNEINSIPGSLAFYLWDLKFIELLDKLISIALKRRRINDNITYTFESNILNSFNGSKKGSFKNDK